MILNHLRNSRNNNHPRPKMVRDNYVILDGNWSFELNPSKTPLKSLTSTILVPFAPETLKSGVFKTVNPDDFMHYQTSFMVETDENTKTFLHFQAVDQCCDVYINDSLIGSHTGGYTSFCFDISNYIQLGANSLYVIANDKTEKSPYGRGKQRLYNTGKMSSIFYTPVSGIWQSVWLECTPIHSISSIDISGSLESKSLNINIDTESNIAEAKISIYDNDLLLNEIKIPTNQTFAISNLDIEGWYYNSPKLYDILITYGEDVLLSYVGFKDVKSIKDSNGILRPVINGNFTFMSGVLDQGYWYETLLSPPSDQSLIDDILLIKEMGFNTIRKHVKVESERFYYHCDRLGMLVWQDIPNGGKDYNFNFVTYFPNISDTLSRFIKDSNYKLFGRDSQESRSIYYKELKEIIHQLKHYPSIVMWVPFNEGWGQFDAGVATQKIRKIDNNRFINEACGWFDQGGGDIFSIHSYFKPLKIKPKNRIVALTEFGGHALEIHGHTFGTKSFGYKKMDAKAIDQAYKVMYNSKVIRNIKNGLSASIFTQLSDVYNEINGLITFDRKIIKVSPQTIKAINNEIYEVFNENTKQNK